MNVPFLDLQAQYKTIKHEIDPAIQNVVNNCSFILGPAVVDFEQSFAKFCNVEHCIGVNSGTSALEIIFKAYKNSEACEAIAPANTFFATTEAMSNAGITPVLVDCNADDALMDVSQIEAAITPRTRFIVPVHLYGQMADMNPIMEIASRHNLIVVEDSAQAHGATYNGRMAGSIGHAAGFSFYPGKNLGAYGDAGGITTNDSYLADFAKMYRDHGMKQKYHHEIIGDNDRMDGIQGAVLGIKLKHLAEWNKKRRILAEHYCSRLENIEGISTLKQHDDRISVHHLFIITAKNRDFLQAELAKRGIATGLHYPIPIHKQNAYAVMDFAKLEFPNAELLANSILSLPMFPELSVDQVDKVCTAIAEIMQ